MPAAFYTISLKLQIKKLMFVLRYKQEQKKNSLEIIVRVADRNKLNVVHRQILPLRGKDLISETKGALYITGCNLRILKGLQLLHAPLTQNCMTLSWMFSWQDFADLRERSETCNIHTTNNILQLILTPRKIYLSSFQRQTSFWQEAFLLSHHGYPPAYSGHPQSE